MINRAMIYGAIDAERDYQSMKWGDNPHEVAAWLMIMEMEMSEAKEGWTGFRGNEHALEEILQVIAVGVACLEQHGINWRTEIESKDIITNAEKYGYKRT